MGALRVIYKLDGVQKHEVIEPKLVDYNSVRYVDTYGMLRNAENYSDCLKQHGARDVRIEWDMTDEKEKSSSSTNQLFSR